MANSNPLISISVVSHGQSDLVVQLLDDLGRLTKQNFEVIVTSNIPEDPAPFRNRTYPVKLLCNQRPKGFGANHNAAFSFSRGNFFAVVNPDIRIPSLDFTMLTNVFANPHVAAVAPIVLSESGSIADSARRFPTLIRFAKRVILRKRGLDYNLKRHPFSVDWVAGMFVLFRADVYRRVGGFDDRRFFMYLEDADICRRLYVDGQQVLLHPGVNVVHMAQRASHRNLKHLRWHVVSAIRYLTGL